ncbi:MAG: hypothetical protein WCT44_01995 [Candidatus Paceibacterota bacterium]
MTKKEKIATKIMYEEYKKSNSTNMQYGEVANRSSGKLTGPDIYQMVNYGRSLYFRWGDSGGTILILTPEGIEYMEKEPWRIAEKWGFWIFGVSSVLAAIFSYFK